jgi:hypothetical protein
MSSNARLALRTFGWLLFLGALTGTAFADGGRDRTQLGHNISVGPGEEVAEATCFGCSVRVRGRVTGDVTTFGGSIVVEDQGQIGGDATSFGGDVRLEKEVKILGDVTVFGGQMRRDATATVSGDVTSFSGTGWLLLVFGLPLVIFGAFVAFVVWLVRRLMRPAMPVAA